MDELTRDSKRYPPFEPPRVHLISAVQEKLSNLHTLFNLSVDLDFIKTSEAVKLLERCNELHFDFSTGFKLIEIIVKRYVHFNSKGKGKGKKEWLEARPNGVSKSVKSEPKKRRGSGERCSIVLSDSCEEASSSD